MAAHEKKHKAVVFLCGSDTSVFPRLQEKVHYTTHDRMCGRIVRVSLNQMYLLTNGELGKPNERKNRGESVAKTATPMGVKRRGSTVEAPLPVQNAVPQSVTGVSSSAASVQIEKIKIPIAQARPPSTREIFENMHLSADTLPSPTVQQVAQSNAGTTTPRGPHGGVRPPTCPASGPSTSGSAADLPQPINQTQQRKSSREQSSLENQPQKIPCTDPVPDLQCHEGFVEKEDSTKETNDTVAPKHHPTQFVSPSAQARLLAANWSKIETSSVPLSLAEKKTDRPSGTPSTTSSTTPRNFSYTSGLNKVPPQVTGTARAPHAAAPVAATATVYAVPIPMSEVVAKQIIPTVTENSSSSALKTTEPNSSVTPTSAPSLNDAAAQQGTKGIPSTSTGTSATSVNGIPSTKSPLKQNSAVDKLAAPTSGVTQQQPAMQPPSSLPSAIAIPPASSSNGVPPSTAESSVLANMLKERHQTGSLPANQSAKTIGNQHVNNAPPGVRPVPPSAAVSTPNTSATAPAISPAQPAQINGSSATGKRPETMVVSPQKKVPAVGVAKFPVAVVPMQQRSHLLPGSAERIQRPPQYNPNSPLAKELQRKVPSASVSSETTASPEPAPPKGPDGGINAVDLLGPDVEDSDQRPVDGRLASQPRCALYEAKRVPGVPGLRYQTYNDYVASMRRSANAALIPIELPTRKVTLDPNHREKQLSFLNRNTPRPTSSEANSVPPAPRKSLATIVKDHRAQRASIEQNSAKKRAAEYYKFLAHHNVEQRKDFNETMELSSEQLNKIIKQEVFKIRRYTKKRGHVMFLQCLPFSGPKKPEVYKPPTEWDKKYILSRLPTASDILQQRRFLKGTSTFRVALRVAQRRAIRALKYEQIQRAYQDYLQAIGADVRGPRDPPRDTQCPRCLGIWLKVVELNKDWEKNGVRSVKRCLWCNDACCHLILLKDVEWEVGKMYGVPKLEELKFGRARVEIDSKGKPDRRVRQYLKDLEIHRVLARKNGVDLTHKDDFYYTVSAGQKRAIKVV